VSGGNQEPFHARLQERYRDAEKAKAEIDKAAGGINYGSRVVKAPLKSIKRAAEKVKNDYGGDPEKITDLARNTIMAKPGTEDKVLAEVLKQYPHAKVSRRESATDPLGYSGIMIKVPTNSDGTGEIQINTPEMMYAKEPKEIASMFMQPQEMSLFESRGLVGGMGHKYYEQWRVLPIGSPEAAKIEQACQRYYAHFRQ
jgi:hypothetical protein